MGEAGRSLAFAKRILLCRDAIRRSHGQALVGFVHDQVDHVMHVVLAFPGRDLPVSAGAFAQDPFDVLDLLSAPEFVDFRSR